MHGTVRSLFRLLGALGMTILVLLAWFGYRLSEGPVNLSFLTPYIQDALSTPDGRLSVKLERTVLEWSGESRLLQLRLEGARAIADDQRVVAAVPEMTVSLSGPALLRGSVAPSALRLLQPSIHLRRAADGRFEFGLGEASQTGDSTAVGEALSTLLAPPGGRSATGQLRKVDVVGGDLTIDDEATNRHWHAPRADLRLMRGQQGITVHARLNLECDGELCQLEANGVYAIDQRAVEANLSFAGIRPALFAALAPQLQPLAALKLQVGGSLKLRYSLDSGLTDIRVNMAGGKGVIDASPWLGAAWPVESVELRGSLGEGLSGLSLDAFRVDLGGSVVELNGRASGIGGDMRVDASARVTDLPVDQLKSLWPAGLAPKPRAWILANLSHGRVRTATAELAAHLPAGRPLEQLLVDKLSGEVVPEGVTVQYLAPMPPVKNVSADAHFDADSFMIDVKSGEVLGLKVEEGKIALLGLSQPDQSADIKLKIAGPIDAALRLIDSKPLGWAGKLGVQPAKVKGEAVTALDLRFPLLATLSLDQMKVHARAQTSHLAMAGVALGFDLSDGNLVLDADPRGLDVAGRARLAGAPADIKWRENFGKASFRSRYQLTMALDDPLRNELGLDSAPFQAPFMTGPVPVDLTATLFDGGKGDIDIRADLTPTAMRLPGLNWEKAPGAAAQAQATLRLANDRLSSVPHFAVNVEDSLAVDGEVSFVDGKARRAVFHHAKWARTEGQGVLTIRPNHAGLDLAVSGPSFDARELVSGQASDPKTDRAPSRDERRARAETAPREDVVPMTVQANFDKAWLSDNGVAKNVTASLVRDHRDWQQARVDGAVGDDGKPLHIEIKPAGKDRRSFKMASADAGAVFRSFDVFENVVGGRLTVEGEYDDADPRQPLTGVASVRDYQVVKAPALARLLTVAALTGIVELLAGDGIHFSTLEAPFALTEGVLDLHDARAYGTSIGITAKGQLDLDDDMLALEGTVVPVYVLNSVLGNIPLVGSLFSAEKGGGIVAMNYSMKGPSEAPLVTVNPLSALTPGFLRKLFDIFDNGTETRVRPQERPGKVIPAPAPPAE